MISLPNIVRDLRKQSDEKQSEVQDFASIEPVITTHEWNPMVS